ncbi:MAG: hypothetical protein OXC40_07995 [Proteobacteria bacterium]|nr:hypothetical protein [Pseudomonadota bacterium]
MTKIGLAHILLGFWLIFLASSGGFFLADHRTDSYLKKDYLELLSWWMVLQKSAHAHTNLFGMLHILTGLSLPYSRLNPTWKCYQFYGLSLGSFAMSVLLFVRSHHIPSHLADPLGWVIGGCLSVSLIAQALHLFGLTLKWYRA